METLRIIFMGTPNFSVPALEQLIKVGHNIVCVYSQPPRPAGRGQKERPSPVHEFAEAHDLKVCTPKSFKTEDVLSKFSDLNADVAVVAAYGLILPKAALDAPKLGCINIHASLLPRWRGAAPIQRAIQAGDKKSGVTIMEMSEGLDTGNTLAVQETPLYTGITASQLHDSLSNIGASLIISTLNELQNGTIVSLKQPEDGVTYAAKLTNKEGRLDWTKPAEELERAIRALNPWPGVWFKYNGEQIKVLSAILVNGESKPGTIIDGFKIACGFDALEVTCAQRPGRKAMDADAFLRGYDLKPGSVVS